MPQSIPLPDPSKPLQVGKEPWSPRRLRKQINYSITLDELKLVEDAMRILYDLRDFPRPPVTRYAHAALVHMSQIIIRDQGVPAKADEEKSKQIVKQAQEIISTAMAAVTQATGKKFEIKLLEEPTKDVK